MSSQIALSMILESIVELLKEEKEALILTDGKRITEIIEKKNQFIKILLDFRGKEIDKDNLIKELIREIESLQELNLLLTKQALSFHKDIMAGIAKTLEQDTYSSKGSYKQPKNIGIVDRSI